MGVVMTPPLPFRRSFQDLTFQAGVAAAAGARRPAPVPCAAVATRHAPHRAAAPSPRAAGLSPRRFYPNRCFGPARSRPGRGAASVAAISIAATFAGSAEVAAPGGGC